MADAILLRVGSKTALYPMIADSQPLATQPWLDTLHTSSDLPPPLARFSAEANRRMTLIDAAALAGIAQRGLEMAVDYAKLREQFGRPIGSFQAIKHHCATMAISAQRSRDQVLFAATAIDEGREDAMLQTDCALLVAARAATANAALNIQIHGGIGFSAEADPHLLVKRTQALIAITGGLEAVNRRIVEWDAGARSTQASVGRR
ncbi:acyl-CoA dehydrogenase family protein [Kineobactrum salinum]|uniref:Acyl-CoA dehydrogenase/oxidase C-terminal domain-containing protein n=1 Tax=Kineobactrum salinum TaxID=2708301 RepID=A0A6C0U496_9GAMM|nr:acyl-CoA dehydrogenase family protein [Kineobactrum salinum]QIB66846.1 hypothetical protein G3T16_17035 [Kineobactrum salinum]